MNEFENERGRENGEFQNKKCEGNTYRIMNNEVSMSGT